MLRVFIVAVFAAVTMSVQSPPARAATAAGPVVVENAKPPAAKRCAKATSRSVRGTIVGQDGLGVKTQIGFDIVDGAGHKISLTTGCPLGADYSAWAYLNYPISGDSAKLGGSVQNAFKLEHLPANASHIYAEAYPRGTNSALHYGHALRRFTPLTSGVTTLHMVAPTTPAYGGSTGTIVVHGSGISFVYARSDAKDGTRLMGWGDGGGVDGVATVPNLASGQTYTIVVTYKNGSSRTKPGITVRPSRSTSVGV